MGSAAGVARERRSSQVQPWHPVFGQTNSHGRCHEGAGAGGGGVGVQIGGSLPSRAVPPPLHLGTDLHTVARGCSTSSVVEDAGPELIIHVDINKTILCLDHIKGYGREEVLYLERWGEDDTFLRWAFRRYGPGASATTTPASACNQRVVWNSNAKADTDGLGAKIDEEYEAWRNEMQLPRNELELVGYAKAYCSASLFRQQEMDNILHQVDTDNSVRAFWNMCEWLASSHRQLRTLVLFRTFGPELPAMFRCVREHRLAHAIARHPDRPKQPLVFTILHQASKTRGTAADAFTCTTKPFDFVLHGDTTLVQEDVVPGTNLIKPMPPVPGLKEKHTDDFRLRTIAFESAAAAQFKSGEYLTPVICTRAVEEVAFNELGTGASAGSIPAVDGERDLWPIEVMPRLLFDKVRFRPGERLKFAGIQDNYKPWSRGNWRNGKPLVLSEQIRQVAFDNAAFGRSEEEGCYIFALFGQDGRFIDGSRSEMQTRFGEHAVETSAQKTARSCGGNCRPEAHSLTIFQTLLVREGDRRTAVADVDYFVVRLRRALCMLAYSTESDAADVRQQAQLLLDQGMVIPCELPGCFRFHANTEGRKRGFCSAFHQNDWFSGHRAQLARSVEAAGRPDIEQDDAVWTLQYGHKVIGKASLLDDGSFATLLQEEMARQKEIYEAAAVQHLGPIDLNWLDSLQIPPQILDERANFVQDATSLEALYALSLRLLPCFLQLVVLLRDRCGAAYAAVGLKRFLRATYKALEDSPQRFFAGDFRKLFDLLRGSLVFENLEAVKAALESLFNLSKRGASLEVAGEHCVVTVVRLKDRFVNPTTSGYRDVLLNVMLEAGSNSLVTEVQLHLRGIYEVKAERGHQSHQWIRRLQATGHAQHNIDPKRQVGSMCNGAGDVYIGAFAQILNQEQQESTSVSTNSSPGSDDEAPALQRITTLASVPHARRNSVRQTSVEAGPRLARSGLGTQFYKWGSIYTGEWAGDLRHGFGVYVSVGGDAYVGEYRAHQKHGWGAEVYVDDDGSVAARFGCYTRGRPSGLHVLLQSCPQHLAGRRLLASGMGRARACDVDRFLMVHACQGRETIDTPHPAVLQQLRTRPKAADAAVFAMLVAAGQMPLPAQVGGRTLESSLAVATAAASAARYAKCAALSAQQQDPHEQQEEVGSSTQQTACNTEGLDGGWSCTESLLAREWVEYAMRKGCGKSQ